MKKETNIHQCNKYCFTLGEWEVYESSTKDEKGHHLYVYAPCKGKICSINNISKTHISKEDLANANLIAAAPAMYRALEALVKVVTMSDNAFHPANVQAKMILKKANPKQ